MKKGSYADQTFISGLETVYLQAQKLDDEQEALKARLQEKTTELDGVLEDLALKVSEGKKIVKLDLPKESWKEFGITDAR